MNLKSYQIKFAMLLVFSLIGTIAFAQDKNLIVIDQDYPNKESLIASVPVSETVLQVNFAHSIWSDLYRSLIDDASIKSIHLFLETRNNKFEINSTEVGVAQLINSSDLEKLGTIGGSNDIDLFVYSCSLANNPEGITLLELIDQKTNFNVMSAKDCNSIFDGNFDFSYSSKGNLASTHLILD